MRLITLTSPLTRGGDVERLQHALNKLHGQHLAEDGQYGPHTDHARYQIGYRLGFGIGSLRLGATPGQQLVLEGQRHRSVRDGIRARQRAQHAHPIGGPGAALAWAHSKAGLREHPPYSNRGPQIDQWERDSGGGVGGPWCAYFVAEALRHAGIILPAGAGYTPNLYAWAVSRTHGLNGLYPWSERQPGDLVLFKFPGVSHDVCDHVGILDADREHDWEGNTSNGDGSQNDGGIVARRDRGGADVAGCARPRWVS